MLGERSLGEIGSVHLDTRLSMFPFQSSDTMRGLLFYT